ncbi:hypothetical protein [Streptomyces sp. NBC_01198]|uniref:hypothetical protein n=1 Tax=Streptomyces sp. NBC_01198 TaxID=2903769 RepID=UPI002E0F0517|nr:hypothetical protein OG702_29140 [Streptomyces sp. NBC_01198]
MSGRLLPDHVRVDVDRVGSEARRACADVLYGTGDARDAAALMRRHPGCLLVSLRDGRGRCTTLVRHPAARRGAAEVRVVRVRTRVLGRRTHALLASLLHARLVAGRREPARRRAPAVRTVRDPAAGPPGGGRPAG